MSGRRSSNILCWAPIITALAVALTALAATAFAALFAPHPGIPASTPPLGNATSVAYSYTFRHAVRNSVLVAGAAGLAVFALARVAQPRAGTLGRKHIWLATLALTPLFLPAPYAAFLWRPLFDRIDIVNRPDAALWALALVQVWRLWPLALLVLPLVRRSSPVRAAAATGILAAWLALLDAGTPLLATGGEPFNETHLWATWAFHTLWVSRLWGHGAVMVGGLAALSGAMAFVVWRTLTPAPSTDDLHAAPTRRMRAVLATGALAAMAPVVWTVSAAWPAFGDGLVRLLRDGYLSWLALSILVLASAALVAAGIAWPARRCRLVSTRLAGICLVAGAAAIPVWYGLLWRWQTDAQGSASLLLAILATGVSAGLVGRWLTPKIANDTDSRNSRFAAACLSLAALLGSNQFALWVVAGAGGAAQTLGVGIAFQAGGAGSTTPAAVAALLTFVATFALISAAGYAGTSRSDQAITGSSERATP